MGGFGTGSESGMAIVRGGLDGGCVRRGLSEVRSGRILGAAFTAVWRGAGDACGVTFDWRGRLGRGGASEALRLECGTAGGDGTGGLKVSVAGKMAVFHGMLMEGATLGSETSGRGGCGSVGDGIVDAVRDVDGGGCADMAKGGNGVGGEAVDGEDEIGGSPVCRFEGCPKRWSGGCVG